MFWDNFIYYCNLHNVKPNNVTKAIGMSNAAATDWKNGSQPRDTAIRKIADYFGVTVDDLKADSNPTPKPEPNAAINLDTSHIHMIPVYESASAGFGTVADNFILEYMPLYVPNAHEAAETLCIKVQGDSMAPKIENGDVIQVHKQDSVDSGAIAVVLVDGEDALVKRVIYGPSFIELHSFNPTYQTVRFDGADVLRVQVIGLVRKIIKSAEAPKTQPSAPSASDSKLAALADKLTDDELNELELLIDYIISKRKNNRPE